LTTPRSPHVITGHAGLIRLDCPVDCLRTVLSSAVFNLLARGYGAPFDSPRTVGDVIELYQQHRLGQIGGLGPRRIGEIEVGLIYVGLILDDRYHP
jgi:hypothetical protein